MNPEPPLLDIDIADKRFGERVILRDVHLRLHPGEVTVLVGASGCGKSTLLRIVAGLDRDFTGDVRLQGRCVTAPVRDIRFVFQEPRLFPWLDVARNVAFDAAPAARDTTAMDAAAAKVAALLRDVGLAGMEHVLPKSLSGGQAQRVAIARGLFAQPLLLLLDEPFSAVDAFTRLKLQDLLLRLTRDRGVAVLMVTHDIDEAVHLGDRVLVLEANPGVVRHEFRVNLPRPRDRAHPEVPHITGLVRNALHAVHAF